MLNIGLESPEITSLLSETEPLIELSVTGSQLDDLIHTLVYLATTNLIDHPTLRESIAIAFGRSPPSYVNAYLAAELRALWLEGTIKASELLSTLYVLVSDPEAEEAVFEILENRLPNS